MQGYGPGTPGAETRGRTARGRRELRHTPRVRSRRQELVTFCLAAALAGSVGAQPLPRVERSAPRGAADLQLAWASIAVEYGRPETHGLTQFGGKIPFDHVWRLGADEATRITVSSDVALGSLTVPAGSYALFAIPHPHSWTLLVNRVAQQWGAWNWESVQDLGRVEVPVEDVTPPLATFTIELEGTGEKEGELRLAWDRVRVRVPLRVLGEPPPPPTAPAVPGGKGKVPPGRPAPPPPEVNRP